MSTQTPDPLPRLEEDTDVLQHSTVSTWNLLRHMLHLPGPETLQGQEAVIAERLAQFVAESHGGVANIPGMRNILEASYNQNLLNARVADVAAGPYQAARINPDIARMDAWIKTICTHFNATEMRNLFNRLPASIMPIRANGRWENSDNIGAPQAIQLGGVNHYISIDLNHPIWRTGDRDTIARLLENRTPAQAGILTDYDDPLQAADIAAILGSHCNAVDPLLSLGQVQLDNTPVIGQRTVVDVAQLVRRDRDIATLTAPAMIAHILGAPAIFALFEESTTRINMNTGRSLGLVAPGEVAAVINQLFDQQSRSRARPFGSRHSTLEEAIERRSPIDRLMTGDASNREVLLALSMIQRDPTAAGVLQEQHVSTDGIRTRLNANEQHIRTAQVLVDLRAAQAPRYSEEEIDENETTLNTLIANINGGRGMPDGTNIQIWDATILPDIGAQNLARRLGIREVLTRRYLPALTPPIDNWNQFQGLLDKIQQEMSILEESRTRIDTMAGFLQSMIPQLQIQGINPAQIHAAAADYPDLDRFLLNNAGANYVIRRRRINARFNKNEITRQYVRALRELNPANRLNLRPLQHYEQQQERLSTELEQAESHHTEHGEAGSEACRAVIRRGLENQGIRPDELDSTVTAMLNSIQQNSSNEADMRMYAEREYPEGPTNEEAFEEWRGTETPRKTRAMYNEYIARLSAANAIGFDLRENAATPFIFGNQSLSRLIDTHFRVKQLTELPLGDPHRLPRNPRVRQFQQELLMHLMDRGAQSLDVSTKNREDLNDMRAKLLHVDVADLPPMTIEERTLYVRGLLREKDRHMNDAFNKQNYDRIVNRTYHPVEQAIARTARRRRWFSSTQLSVNPVSWVVAPLRGVYNYGISPIIHRAVVPLFNGEINMIKKHPAVAVVAGFAGLTLPPFGPIAFSLLAPPIYHGLQKVFGGGAGGADAHGHAAPAHH